MHALVAELGEEPKSLATWGLLDSHATRSELITRYARPLSPEPYSHEPEPEPLTLLLTLAPLLTLTPNP